MILQGIKVAVLGAGSSGKAAAKLALAHGAQVCVFDSAESVANWDEDLPLKLSATPQCGVDYAAELVVISPGIESDCAFVQAFALGAKEVIGELELACRFYKGKIIAITGTNGKTTTTGLVEAMLTAHGISTVACGNYGLPVAMAVQMQPVPEVLALEVSSFQLETVKDFHPDVAIWLNFAPDHTDRYLNVVDYYNAKLRIFENMTPLDLAVVRAGEHLPALPCEPVCFSTVGTDATAYYQGGKIWLGSIEAMDLRGSPLEQRHNAENVMAALLACMRVGVSIESASRGVQAFHLLGHRCEIVRVLRGVTWINDSKATNLHAVESALCSQDSTVVLIAGGKDKGLDYLPLSPVLERKVRATVVFGEIKEQLYKDFSPVVPTYKADTLEQCVSKAHELAHVGDVVLLSPGTSSFDMFTGYVQRGQVFCQAVHALGADSTTNTDHN